MLKFFIEIYVNKCLYIMVAVKQVFFVLIVPFKCVHMHLLLDVSLIW